MLRDEPFLREYTGDVLRDTRIRVVPTEPRAFVLGAKERFDLVEIGLVDSVGLSQTGGNPVTENFLYTAEGIASYLTTLRPGGILSITVWNRLTPPRNVPKLLSTVAEALRIRGIADPGQDVFVFDQLLSTATILVKNGPFVGDELRIASFCSRMSFIPCYYPGMPRPSLGSDAVLRWYAEQLGTAGAASSDSPAVSEVPAASGEIFSKRTYTIIPW